MRMPFESTIFRSLRLRMRRVGFALLTLLAVLVSAALPVSIAAPLSADAPVVVSVSPSQGYNDETTALTITGQNFVATPTVTLGRVSLPGVVWIDSATLTTTVPPDLPAGTYDLTVTNPDAQTATLPDAFTAQMSGDGTIGRWRRTATMTRERDGLYGVVNAGRIYAVGGFNGIGVPTDTVEYATIEADGSLSPWQATATMTTPRGNLAAVTAGSHVYALGGSSDHELASVERSTIQPNGVLSPWQPTSALTTPRDTLVAISAHDHLYVLGGSNGVDGFLSSVERAAILPDGSLDQWEVISNMTTPRGGLAAVVVGGYLYALGGACDQGYLTSVERATLYDDGSLGPWEVVGDIPQPVTEAGTVVSRGYLYLLGGFANGIPIYNVYRAAIQPNGSLGPWHAATPTTVYRANSGVVGHNGFLYALGGFYLAVSAVELVEVHPVAPAILDYGLSINAGALFTNRIDVTLTIGAPLSTGQMQVSNDGGFAGAAWEPYAQAKPWQITQYGSYVIPRVVYVRYRDYDGNISSTFQDDIILDVNAPSGSVDAEPGAARAVTDATVEALPDPSGVVAGAQRHKVHLPLVASCYPQPATGPANITLHLSASDDVSGVGTMMISNRSDFACASWQSYKATQGWYVPVGATTVYVKFRDNAGNVSAVVSDTIAR